MILTFLPPAADFSLGFYRRKIRNYMVEGDEKKCRVIWGENEFFIVTTTSLNASIDLAKVTLAI